MLRSTALLATALLFIGATQNAPASAGTQSTTGNTAPTGTTARGATPTLMLNGRPVNLDVAPTMVGDVVMVPIRFMSETLGFKVDWNGATKQIRIQRLGGEDRVTVLTVGSTRAQVNAEPRTLTQSPVVLAGRTLIPLREVARFYDAQINYNPNSRVVFVSTPGGSLEPAMRTGRDVKNAQ